MVSCPYCGSPVRADAPACPVCGSDERTGWSEQTYMDGIDLPDDAEYNDILEKEFTPQKKNPFFSWRAAVGSVVAGVFILLLLRQGCPG